MIIFAKIRNVNSKLLTTDIEMKKIFLFLVAVFLGGALSAQVTLTVVGTDGSSQDVELDATGEIYFGTDYMAVLTSSSTGNMQVFQMDDVRKVLFANGTGDVHIVDVRDAQPLRIWPNPARETMVVGGLGDEPMSMSVYTLSGRQVLQGTCRDGEPVDISTLEQGIYFVRVGASIGKLVKF